LPNGDALFTGTNGTTALYNPNTNSWTQGPTMPSVMIDGVSTQLTTGDAPGAILPNGDVVLALSPAVYIDQTGEEQFPPPTYIYDFNPTADVWTNITPSASIDPNLSTENSFVDTMLILPTGQLLLTDDNNQLAVYTPNGSPQAAWQPTITSFTQQSGNDYTLTGTQTGQPQRGSRHADRYAHRQEPGRRRRGRDRGNFLDNVQHNDWPDNEFHPAGLRSLGPRDPGRIAQIVRVKAVADMIEGSDPEKLAGVLTLHRDC